MGTATVYRIAFERYEVKQRIERDSRAGSRPDRGLTEGEAAASGLNDHAASFQSPTAHLWGTAVAGGVLVIAATAAGMISIVYSWVTEMVSGSRVVINATTT